MRSSLTIVEPTHDQTIPYDKAVAEGKDIVCDVYGRQWRLGELANLIEPKYGGETLAKFADEIGISYSTARDARAVVRAWPKNVRRLTISYGIARSLITHPDREQIVRENPCLTVAQARKLVLEYKESIAPNDEQEDDEPTDDNPLATKWLDTFAQMTKCSTELVDGWDSLSFADDEKEYIISLAEKAAKEWLSIAEELRRNIQCQ